MRKNTQQVTWPQMREYVSNMLMAVIFSNATVNFYHDYALTGRISSLLYVISELYLVAVFLTRRPPKAVSWKGWDWLCTMAAMVFPLLVVPVAGQQADPPWLAVQCLGIAVSLAGLVSINRSFGVVPANRGVKTGGIYRLVRHPVYLGYSISYAAVLAQNWTQLNLLFTLGYYIAQALRIRCEERFLGQDSAYADYASKVKWRLLPGVW